MSGVRNAVHFAPAACKRVLRETDHLAHGASETIDPFEPNQGVTDTLTSAVVQQQTSPAPPSPE
jgi:hypothetical protein